jgi:membrane-associated phospholipid phosphatase
MGVIYNRDHVPDNELLALNKNNINRFDRPIADNYSPKAADLSNQFFYGSMPLPLLFVFDKKIRKDGLKIGLLYLETMGITGTIYTVSAMSVNRFRPYAYNPNVDMDVRRRGGARNSFFAGHVAVVASSTFFMAQVYTHYHPDMKGKWILYTLAGAATATTGLLRLQAGQHFKTDVIVGVLVGTLVGNLVPHFHSNKSYEDRKLTLLPSYQNGGTGFTAFYKLGRK